MKHSLVLVLVLAAALVLLPYPAMLLRYRKLAPLLLISRFLSQDGNKISLDQFRGKWVVLYFYPRDMTSGCTIEAHNFQRDQQKYLDRNTVVLGVSVDSVESHQKFCTKEGLNFKLLSDSDHKVAEEYGSLTKPGPGEVRVRADKLFIINPEGKIAKVYTDVNPNEHSAEVLAELAQLQK